MNKRKEQKQEKQQICQDMRELADILQKETICADPNPLIKAANNCLRDTNGWYYTLEPYSFKLLKPPPSGILPLDLEEIRVILEIVELEGNFSIKDRCNDPLKNVKEFNILLEGRSQDERYHFAWHLDRDENEPGRADHQFVHPRYHFQIGGKKLETTDIGKIIISASPRLSHPPMDAILGIDFILSNFYGDAWKKLRNNNERYVRIQKSAQKRMWQPYMKVLGDFWPVQKNSDPWYATDIWPHLILED